MIAPRLQFSVLCDEVVTKPDGKMVFWGVFAGFGAVSFPVTFPQMFCVNGWMGGSGEFQEVVEFFSPDRAEKLVEVRHTISPMSLFGPTTNVHQMIGVTFREPGIYWIAIKLGQDLKLEYPLNVVQLTLATDGLSASEGQGVPPPNRDL